MNEIAVRALSGLVYVVILITGIVISPDSYYILVLLLGTATFIESCIVRKINPFFITGLYIVLLSLVHFLPVKAIYMQWLLPLFIVTNLLLLWRLFKKSLPKPLTKYLHTLYLFTGFLCLYYIAFFKESYFPQLTIAMFVLIWVNDIFAYLMGKFFGKNKLISHISPKKTIEGFIGGCMASLITGVVFFKILNEHTVIYWIVLALIISIFGTFGDLVQSQLKREAGVKDSGFIMPGHGGIYDRLDSIVFAVPFVYLYILLNHVS